MSRPTQAVEMVASPFQKAYRAATQNDHVEDPPILQILFLSASNLSTYPMVFHRPCTIYLQQPIVYGEQDAAAPEVADEQDRPSDNNLPTPTEDPRENVADGGEIGGASDGVVNESLLQELADDMAARRERKTHIEVDRELGLAFGDDPHFSWRGRESTTNHLYGGVRVYHDTVDPSAETELRTEGSDALAPSYTYPPRQRIRADGTPSPHRRLFSEKNTSGLVPASNMPKLVPPVLAPGNSPTVFHPVPAVPGGPQSKANLSRLPVSADMGFGNPSRTHGNDRLEETPVDGEGFAVARARQRLNSLRAARQSMSIDPANVHEATPPPQKEAKAMLGRLKEMRHYFKV